MPRPRQDSAAFPWSSTTTYSIGSHVRFSGFTYQSLTNSNLNNAPTGAASDNANWAWTTIAVVGGSV